MNFKKLSCSFQDLGVYTIDSTMVSEHGDFTLNYADKHWVMEYLASKGDKAYFVMLAKEDIQLKGKVLIIPERIITLSVKENQLFAQYASEHPRREQAFSVWDYLAKIYKQDSFLQHIKYLN